MNERWQQLADDEAIGEALSEEERDFVRRFADADADAERDFYARLGALGMPTTEDAAHDEDMTRALATMAAWQQQRATPRRRPWVIGLVAGGLAAAAALVITLTLPKGELARSSTDGSDSAVVSSGALLVDEARLDEGAPLPLDRWVVADGRTCVHADEATTCVEASTRVRARERGVEVESGTVDFEGDGRLLTPYGALDASHATFQLQLTGGQMFITVTAGDVTLTDAKGRTLEWGAGDSERIGDDDDVVAVGPDDDEPIIVDDDGSEDDDTDSGRARRPSTPQASAGELLSEARQLRGSGNEGRALATYAKLQRLYPRSAEAQAADVSIGQLHLKRGNAKAALKAFDRYLQRGGPLAEEAHWGKIRALDKLGRSKARDAAIDRLRAKFPGSVYATRAEALGAD